MKKEFENELTDNILNYWVKRVYDPQRKNFFGMIDRNEVPHPEAAHGVVLISRILWTFSAAYQLYPTAVYQKIADEAYHILTGNFWDKEFGGVYWSVKPDGEVEDSSKQFYAQSFAIYGLSEYARTFNHKQSKELAVSLYMLMERYAFDPEFGGYFEANAANWTDPSRDYITPAGDNTKKSMNTHLHVLEAYTNLFRIYPDEGLKNKIIHILDMFTRHIINPQNHHFHLFFEADWSVQSKAISYGHDIEGSWLLWEAAEVIHDKQLLEKLKPVLVNMAYAVGNAAIDQSGGLYNESEGDHWDKNFHWWPQSEAVVGFYNAWQLIGDQQFLKWSIGTWEFIKKYQVDQVNGEWHSLITPDLKASPAAKVSPWKCPYHNGRMCMEMIRRIGL